MSQKIPPTRKSLIAVIAFSLPVLSTQLSSEEVEPPGETGTHQAPTVVEMAEFKPEFPKPMFLGRPVKAALPNLERPEKPKLTFTAPKGSTNVAFGKPVTSSDPLPIIGELGYVTNGDLRGAEGSYVELSFGTQWVQIDLEANVSIHAILVWHFHTFARAYKDVVVQVSNDLEFKEGVTTVFNSDDDDSLGFGKGKDPTYMETNHGRIIDLDGVEGRYVRLYSGGNSENDSNHYVEVQVYGLPTEKD